MSAVLAMPSARAWADFASCLAGLRGEALANGVTSGSFSAYAAGLQPNDAPSFLGAQPEFNVPIWDYLGGLIDEERVRDGLASIRQYPNALAAAEKRFGVDRYIVAAVWGVESDFGRSFGKRPVLESLASLACSQSSRRAYFRKEFIAALGILQSHEIRPEHFYGSWAGAFGHTQFMPTTWFHSAVDMDGDARRDVVDSPPDALGSAANYLRQHGWRPGLGWGFEVRVPASYKGPTGRLAKRPMAFWASRKIVRIDDSGLGSGEAGLLLPQGVQGPAFLVTRNFDALYSYNAADSYALAIGLLSNRLRGRAGLVTPWPGGEVGLSRAERREVQTLLASRGYQVGDPDGVLGVKSRAAIVDAQGKMGMTPNGWASAGLLRALRGAR